MMAPTFWLVLILHGGQGPAMVTMPLTMNSNNCQASGKEWVAAGGTQYRREFMCVPSSRGTP